MGGVDVGGRDQTGVVRGVPVTAEVGDGGAAQERRVGLDGDGGIDGVEGDAVERDHRREEIVNLGLVALALGLVEFEVETQQFGQDGRDGRVA